LEIHIVHVKSKSACMVEDGTKDGVEQVKAKAEPKYLETTWDEDEARTQRVGVRDLAWQIHEVARWMERTRVCRFHRKTRGTADRRTNGTITKLALRRSKVVKGAGPFDAGRKTWTKMPLCG
jgi:hypothetical protein